ncbi:hypothetical protein BH11PLA2_BH11PLA2_11590 [soil metagenome]
MPRWFAPTVLLTFVCFGTGYFGWKTGIPAQWIFAIWPPAGFALAAIFAWGNRAIPGVFLGNLLCLYAVEQSNWNLFEYLDILTTRGELQKARQAVHNFRSFEGVVLLGAVLISVINVLQASIGAALVRRILGSAPALTKPGSIVAFLTIIGPVQGAVSALLGPLLRIELGQRSAEQYDVYLLTWWLNETLGGFVFGTIAFTFVAQPASAWRPRRLTVALPMLVAILAFVTLDEFGPAEIIALPKLTRHSIEIVAAVLLFLFAVLLLVITGQAAAIREEATRVTEDLFNETSARLFAQNSLASSETSLAEAQRIARVGSWNWDPLHDNAEWSDELFRLFGHVPGSFVPTHSAFLECVHPEDRNLVETRMRAAIANEQPYEFDFRVARPDGEVRIFHVDALIERDDKGKPIRWHGTDQDVTERVKAEDDRRRLDDRLRTTQRWESLGQLAGGIAHDFNNLMSGVLGYATLAREQLKPDAEMHELLKPIEEAAVHAASLCQQLLTFAGKGISARGAIEVNTLIQESAELIRMAVPRNIDLRIGTAHDLPIVEGDRSQLKQVLLNLVWNAADAVGLNGGVIEIRAGSSRSGCCPTQSPGHYCSTLVPGSYVWLEVRDTGCGIPEETLARIFDPFFTTKDVGRGLGLSAVAGIVRSHGGVVCVNTRTGVGTSIRVYLSALDDEPTRRTPPPVINTPREIPHPPLRPMFLANTEADTSSDYRSSVLPTSP